MRTTTLSRRFRSWLSGALLAAAIAPSVAVGEIPSRLVLAAPPAGAVPGKLSWSFPFTGWTYEVQSQEQLGGPWSVAPFGSGLVQPTWSETRPGANASRWYRVAATPPPGTRGRLVSAVKFTSYTKLTLTFFYQLQGIPLVPQYDVDVYKIVYETIDPYGAPAIVSGEFAVPVATGKTWPLFEYAHGTSLQRSDAPSTPQNSEGLLGVVMAAAGYVAVLPDYLGLGDSNLVHPYHHAASEATCMVDGLRAARLASSANGIALNGQLFVCGYSQGGHVAMATLRELERNHAAEFPVTACAAMAGAYDLSGVTLDDALSDRQPPNTYYFAYLLNMIATYYRIAPSLGSMLQEPYATLVPPLLDGTHAGSEVNLVLPKSPKLALKPAILAAVIADPNHPLRLAARDNDLTRFKPVSPLHLYHCSGDLDVVPANSQVALKSFHDQGATQVVFDDPKPGADHGGCVQPSLLAAKAWFDSLKH